MYILNYSADNCGYVHVAQCSAYKYVFVVSVSVTLAFSRNCENIHRPVARGCDGWVRTHPPQPGQNGPLC